MIGKAVVFTNLMAARNLRAAIDACARHPDLATGLSVTPADLEAWRAAADAVHVPFDERLGVHPQSEGFTRYAAWDFEASREERPLMLHAPYFQLYRRQVVKQADLVLAMHWCPEAFTTEQKPAASTITSASLCGTRPCRPVPRR